MNEQTLDETLSDVVNDVAPPSAIADREIQQAETVSTYQQSDTVTQPEKRGRGRPRKNPQQETPKAKPKLVGVAEKSEVIENGASFASIESCANVAAGLIEASGAALGGEAAIMQEQERMLVRGSFVEYFKVKGVENVPPWVILAGGVMPYYARVLTLPPARSKVAIVYDKAVYGVKSLFGKIFKRGSFARPDNRNDIERQDDTGKKVSKDSKPPRT